VSAPERFPDWDTLQAALPEVVATMRRYLEQLGCVLRPRSVGNADQALRALAAFLAEQQPEVTSVAQISRRHIEDFIRWLAARSGRSTAKISPATLAHRLGTLRMFFVRISEWDWPDAPGRVPIIPGDLPRQDHPLPKALDDAAAAQLLRAAQDQRRMLVRVVVEVLLRTGLRVGEFTALAADAVVLIGAGHWLHVPIGKLHDDRYLPLHPHLVTLIADYRATHVRPDNPLLLPRENGTALDRHTITRMINRAGRAAGLPHIHPHQLRHTLATQAINRGMTLEAIAALLGHRSLDMTLRYARSPTGPSPTSTSPSPRRSKPSINKVNPYQPTRSGRGWPGCAASTTACSATATAPGRPSWTAHSRPSAKPARSSRPASSSDPPCNANATTQPTTTSPIAPTCSISS
jgi:site-specific recombinase XerD